MFLDRHEGFLSDFEIVEFGHTETMLNHFSVICFDLFIPALHFLDKTLIHILCSFIIFEKVEFICKLSGFFFLVYIIFVTDTVSFEEVDESVLQFIVFLIPFY
mgnify:CR=1 FL=1